MLMERQVIQKMTESKDTLEQVNEKIDKYVIHSFVNAFNKKYGDLLENQKNLLKKYMIATEDDNTDFLVFLNEELQNIANKLNNAHLVAEVKEDKEVPKVLIVKIAVKSSSEIKPYLLNNGDASLTSIYIMKL